MVIVIVIAVVPGVDGPCVSGMIIIRTTTVDTIIDTKSRAPCHKRAEKLTKSNL